MFTGLVLAQGVVEAVTPVSGGVRLAIGAPLGILSPGESICTSGACLTVTHSSEARFSADLSQETLDRTWFSELRPGSRVNLERSLAVGDRLGGHFVTGHVDRVARVTRVSAWGNCRQVEIEVDEALRSLIAPKGSVTLDGVSLTVNRVLAAPGKSGPPSSQPVRFEVMLVPHTLAVTTLGAVREGLCLNLEADLLARYVANVLGTGRPGLAADGDRVLTEALERAGFLEPQSEDPIPR